MSSDADLGERWEKAGAALGILSIVVFVLAAAVPLPDRAVTLCAAAFGPLLGLASVGLYHFVARRGGRSLLLQVAAISNLIAGALVNAMLLVQLAVHPEMGRAEAAASPAALPAVKAAARMTDKVQLGLDVSWDVYISIGTLCFGLAMLLGMRGLGRALGAIAVALALALLALNLWTFPTPPAQGGSVDIGPFVGLWYFVMSVWMAVASWRRRAAAPALATASVPS